MRRLAQTTRLVSIVSASWLVGFPAFALDRSDVIPKVSQLAFTAVGNTLLVAHHYDDRVTGRLIGSSISEMRVADGHIATLVTSCDLRYDDVSPSPDDKLVGVIFTYTGSLVHGSFGAPRLFTGPQVVAVYPYDGMEGRPLWVDDDGKTVGSVSFGESADDLLYVAKKVPGEPGDGKGDNLVRVNLRSGEKKITSTNVNYVGKAQLVDRTHVLLLGRIPEKAALGNLAEFPDLADQPLITSMVVLLLDLESGTLTLHDANKQIDKRNRIRFQFAGVNHLSDGRLFIMSVDISLAETRGSHIGLFRDGHVEYFMKLDDMARRFTVSPHGQQAAFVTSEKVEGLRDTFSDRLGIVDLKSGNIARFDMTDDRFLGPVAAKCAASTQPQ